jgi:hypothetical protein
MKAKILIILAILVWLIPVCFILHAYIYKPYIVKERQEAFMQGVNAVQRDIIRQVTTHGFLPIVIDGKETIFEPVRYDKKGKRIK